MDKQEYLNQISASTRPVKKTRGGFLNSIYFKIILGVIIGLIIILILGAILSGGRGDEKTRAISLKIRIDNTAEIVSNYQSLLKSSNLRSSSASLYSILSNTTRELTEYLEATYEFKEKDVEQSIIDKETTETSELESELFSAKINGILDRIFAHKMAYEVSVITTREAELINSTRNSELKELLTTSYNSLENLYNNFNDFSEAN